MRDGEPLVVFAHFPDQRLYRWEPGAEPVPLTPVSPVGPGLRWAEPVVLAERGEVWCVLEEFTGDGPSDVRRVLAAVPLDGSAAEDRGAVRELTGERHRFVTGPRLSPDGTRAAWIGWDHPRMPWDGTELIVADVAADGTLTGARTVAGGPRSPSRRPTGPTTTACCTPATAPAGGTSTGTASRSARAPRSSPGRCGNWASAGSPRWTAG
ncbi:hypothetical protein STENM223S_04438 [Streptomyces tendae]